VTLWDDAARALAAVQAEQVVVFVADVGEPRTPSVAMDCRVKDPDPEKTFERLVAAHAAVVASAVLSIRNRAVRTGRDPDDVATLVKVWANELIERGNVCTRQTRGGA
jgi:hypothetical protein